MAQHGCRVAGGWLGAAALVLLALQVAAGADDPPLIGNFPPTTAVPKLALQVGDRLTIGGPASDNFLPNEWMNVYVVPHRTWRDGDPLGANAVMRVQIRSDAKGQLPLTHVWKIDRAGRYDIIVDYDGDGRFSYKLDSLDAFDVRAK